jgi:hypothetical protein
VENEGSVNARLDHETERMQPSLWKYTWLVTRERGYLPRPSPVPGRVCHFAQHKARRHGGHSNFRPDVAQYADSQYS